MNNSDIWGGLALIVFAALYAWAGSDLRLTSSLGIGPGLFPMLLAGILALIGAGIAAQGLISRRAASAAAEPRPAADPVPIRGLVLVAAGPALFAILVGPLGVVPALGIAVFVSALASSTMTLLGAAVSAVLLVVGSVLLFRTGLGLPLELFGDLFRFGE